MPRLNPVFLSGVVGPASRASAALLATGADRRRQEKFPPRGAE
jgi:hypothetical protein